MYNEPALPPRKSSFARGLVRGLAAACGAAAGAISGLITGGSLAVAWVAEFITDFEEAGEERALGAAVVFLTGCLAALAGASLGLWAGVAATAATEVKHSRRFIESLPSVK
jgi:hypothetical protein